MPRSTVCRGKEPDGTPCANPTSDPSQRCPLHPLERTGFGARFKRTPSHAVHRSYRWQKLSRRYRAWWVRQHGWTCAGFRRPAHPARDLATDHIVPVSEDDSRAFDWSNLQCLCRSCNARKSLSQRRR
jgi:5-methylcytosine-specific restriction endonuclease McrA